MRLWPKKRVKVLLYLRGGQTVKVTCSEWSLSRDGDELTRLSFIRCKHRLPHLKLGDIMLIEVR